MVECPYCSHKLLLQIRNGDSHWFCQHCWQELPISKSSRAIIPSLSLPSKKAEQSPMAERSEPTSHQQLQAQHPVVSQPAI